MDKSCFWLNLNTVPKINKSAIELFSSYQAVDAHWILGGKICGLRFQDSFVLPRVELNENEVYYPLLYSSLISTYTVIDTSCRMTHSAVAST